MALAATARLRTKGLVVIQLRHRLGHDVMRIEARHVERAAVHHELPRPRHAHQTRPSDKVSGAAATAFKCNLLTDKHITQNFSHFHDMSACPPSQRSPLCQRGHLATCMESIRVIPASDAARQQAIRGDEALTAKATMVPCIEPAGVITWEVEHTRAPYVSKQSAGILPYIRAAVEYLSRLRRACVPSTVTKRSLPSTATSPNSELADGQYRNAASDAAISAANVMPQQRVVERRMLPPLPPPGAPPLPLSSFSKSEYRSPSAELGALQRTSACLNRLHAGMERQFDAAAAHSAKKDVKPKRARSERAFATHALATERGRAWTTGESAPAPCLARPGGRQGPAAPHSHVTEHDSFTGRTPAPCLA